MKILVKLFFRFFRFLCCQCFIQFSLQLRICLFQIADCCIHFSNNALQ